MAALVPGGAAATEHTDWCDVDDGERIQSHVLLCNGQAVRERDTGGNIKHYKRRDIWHSEIEIKPKEDKNSKFRKLLNQDGIFALFFTRAARY